MMFYTMSQVITLCKQNMGIHDLPKTFTDKELEDRLVNSALKEFSVRYPCLETFCINNNERVERGCLGLPTSMGTNRNAIYYRIPKNYYQDRTVFSVTDVDVFRPSGFNDYYIPQGMTSDPVSIMSAVSDLKVAAAMARSMSRAYTWRFYHPDILEIYNGWMNATWTIELSMSHDPSLSTIPPTAMSSFIQLAELDLKELFYQRLKRIQGYDLGVSTIELKIDDWANAGEQKQDLLKSWDETANLDVDLIMHF